jgi:hypothetical protein
MLTLFVAVVPSIVFVWSLFQIQSPVRGIVFDFDVIEHTRKGFIGIHKVVFNNSESIPVSCVHVLTHGSNKADILTRVAVPAPFEQDFVLDKFGFCKPFEESSVIIFTRFVCVIILFACVFFELAYQERESARKINVLPMRRSDPNMKLTSVSSEGKLNSSSSDAKEV